MQKKIGSQMQCKKMICGSEFVKLGTVEHRSMRMSVLIKAKGGVTKYRLHDVDVQVLLLCLH